MCRKGKGVPCREHGTSKGVERFVGVWLTIYIGRAGDCRSCCISGLLLIQPEVLVSMR